MINQSMWFRAGDRGGRRVRGFTLIELVIVMSVIAILVSIALPVYNDSIRKSRRGVAKADVVQIAQMMERCFTAANTYVNCVPGDTLTGALAQSPAQGTRIDYTLGLTPAPTRTTYTVLATRQGGQVDDRCGNLSLNQTGVKAVSVGTVEECW